MSQKYFEFQLEGETEYFNFFMSVISFLTEVVDIYYYKMCLKCYIITTVLVLILTKMRPIRVVGNVDDSRESVDIVA